jgi:hypothetical protein
MELGKKTGLQAAPLKKLAFFLIGLACMTLTAAKYPPGQRWREVTRGPLTVIFPERFWLQAEAALAAAEKAYGRLERFWSSRPTGQIRIVLDDSSDEANGFATVFPYHLVGINLFQPAPDSTLACSYDWFDLVLGHELTHVFNLERASAPFTVLRRVFGSHPALFPAAQLPPWVTEGLAVFCESEFSGDGRLNHAPYRLMLQAARRDGLFPGWSPISGTPAAWPGASAKYLFGAGFMDYLASAYGPEKLRDYLQSATRLPFLFSSSFDFEWVFGKSLSELWQEFMEAPPANGQVPDLEPRREPLTDRGFSNQYPCPVAEGRLAYYHRNFRERGTVEILDLDTGRSRPLFQLNAVNAISSCQNGSRLFLSASDNFRSFSEFSDLYEYDIEKRTLRRLSYGHRLFQPVQDARSGLLYCVQRREGGFVLARFDSEAKTASVLSRPFTGMSQLSVSPDGTLIAAAVKDEGGPWGIAIFGKDGSVARFIHQAGSDLSQPRWMNDRTILFISSGKDDSYLAACNLETASSGPSLRGAARSFDDPSLSGLRQFAVSGRGSEIFFSYYSGRGQEIARFDLGNARCSPLEVSLTREIPASGPQPPPPAPRSSSPYRFWRDLRPHYWGPSLRMGGDEYQAGIMTTGQDALGIHRFSLEAYFGLSSLRPSVLFRYQYDGLWPTLAVTYDDSSDYYGDIEGGTTRRAQELNVESLWPLRVRNRSQLRAYADLHMERRTAEDEPGVDPARGVFNGARLGLDFNSSREYYDSVSPADGVSLTLQLAIHPAALGNSSSSRSLQADWRHYLSLFRPGVLAWRLAAARSWGAGAEYYFSGGSEGEGGRSLGQSRPFDLLRAFPSGYQSGDRGWQCNIEYRLPLFKIEKAFLPAFSLDRVYLNVFCDAGRLWQGETAWPAVYCAGVEGMLRLTVGGSTAFDLASGVAYGFGPESRFRFFTRLGRSF